MATVSKLTINEDTREIADDYSRQKISELETNLSDEISNRENAIANLMTLINQNEGGAVVVMPSFSIDENGHLIAEFAD
jgi:hypothetical protein